MKSILKLAGFFTILLFVLSSCSKKDDASIRIGLAGPMTGPDGQMGASIINGSQMAIDEWNAKGGVLGKKIVGIARDDEAKPDKAVTVAQDLASRGVVGVLGHLNSGCTLPASSIYSKNKIVQITTSSNPQITEQGINTLFRIDWRDDQAGGFCARVLHDRMRIAKIAILHNKTTYGEGYAQIVKQAFEKLGGQITFYEGVPKQELDFRSNLSKIKESGAEALVWGGFYDQAGPLAAQAREAGLNFPITGSDAVMDKNFIATAGAAATNFFIIALPDYNNIPAAQPFLQKYRAKYGPEGAYTIYGYDSANVLLEAIQAAGSTDSEKVAAAMRSKTFNTCLGPVEYDEKGDLKKVTLAVWTVVDGKFVVAGMQ